MILLVITILLITNLPRTYLSASGHYHANISLLAILKRRSLLLTLASWFRREQLPLPFPEIDINAFADARCGNMLIARLAYALQARLHFDAAQRYYHHVFHYFWHLMPSFALVAAEICADYPCAAASEHVFHFALFHSSSWLDSRQLLAFKYYAQGLLFDFFAHSRAAARSIQHFIIAAIFASYCYI